MQKKYAIADKITGDDIRALRAMLKISRREFAELAGVSLRTVEHWETSEGPITGPVVFMYYALFENRMIAERLEMPEQEMPLRLIYMYKSMPCTVIDVDDSCRLVKIANFTRRLQFRAFGAIENPDYDEYLDFLKSRCFPESRDKMKLELERLGLPFYDPLMIIERTEGRMEEDLFHIEILRKRV